MSLGVLLVFLALKPTLSFSQISVVDSLKSLLSDATEESARLELINQLSLKLLDNDPSQSRLYAEEALKLSRSNNNIEQEIKALYSLGVLDFDTTAKRDSSILFFLEGEKKAEANNFKELQSDHLMRLANYHRYHSRDSSKTVEYLLKSVEVSKSVDYHYGAGRSYAKLASFYTRYKEVQLCEDYLKLSAPHYLKLPNGAEEIAHYYDEVGNKIWDYFPKKSMDLYFKGLKYSESYPNLKVSLAKAYLAIEEPKNAMKYLNEALEVLKVTQYPRIRGIAIAKLAEVYLQLKDYKQALKACNDGIELLKLVSPSTQTALPALYRLKGTLKGIDNKESEAIANFKQSIDEAYKINEVFDIVKSHITLGEFYASRRPERGNHYCEFALEKAKENNFINLEIEACDCLYSLSKKEGLYSNALSYFEKRNQLKDSISTLRVEHALDINSQIALKDKQIAQESYLKDIKEAELNNQFRITRILYISTFFGLLLIGLLSWGIGRIRRQNTEIILNRAELVNANNDLAKSNEELERFAHVASHDLKSPLNSIVSFAGLLRRKLKDDASESVKEYISYIETNGTRMRRLIDDILQYSKLSSNDTSDHEEISLDKLVHEISQLVLSTSKGKKVNIEASELPNLKWNYSKIFLLFKNFIENGLKYNESENPSIKLHYTNSNGKNIVHITDNGIGIKEEYFDKIFLMFNRLHGEGQYEGTGLGLATCKKIVDEFKGKIEVSSQLNEGTTFKIEIPDHLLS